MPRLRHISSERQLTAETWTRLHEVPVAILIITHSVPIWLNQVLQSRPVAVICTSQSVRDQLEISDDCVAVLDGVRDLEKIYRIMRFNATTLSRDVRIDTKYRYPLLQYQAIDQFRNRANLEFLPLLDVRDTISQRPAAILFNRIVNSQENDNVILLEDQVELSEPHLLSLAMKACCALAIVESSGQPLPSVSKLPQAFIEECLELLQSESTDWKAKQNTFFEIGRRLLPDEVHGPILFLAPTARKDFAKGKAPASVVRWNQLALPPRTSKRILLVESGDARAQEENRRAENEAVAIEAALLAGSAGCTPIVARMNANNLHGQLRQLNDALQKHTAKVPKLFQEFTLRLKEAVEEKSVGSLTANDDHALILSDLPIEWLPVGTEALCLIKSVSRLPVSNSRWSMTMNALEQPVMISSDPKRVLVLELMDSSDPLRTYTSHFKKYSDRNLGAFTFRSPRDPSELIDALRDVQPEIVVLDGHGRWDRENDELFVLVGKNPIEINRLIDATQRMPPVWLLSSCQTSVAGAVNGSLSRKLLSQGALCVLATLNPISAWFASKVVTNILGAIYPRSTLTQHRNFGQVIFHTRLAASILYEKMLPLYNKAYSRSELRAF